MEWITEHLRLIILVGGAFAYWLHQRKKAKAEAEDAGTLATEKPSSMQSPMNDDSERVRRIQEEIRRKILERARGGAPLPQSTPMQAPLSVPPPVPVKSRSEPDAYRQQPLEEPQVAIDQALLERQQELATKFRELEEKRRHTADKADVFTQAPEGTAAASPQAKGGGLLADLRSPSSARRAIVMREVLGVPVGLR